MNKRYIHEVNDKAVEALVNQRNRMADALLDNQASGRPQIRTKTEIAVLNSVIALFKIKEIPESDARPAEAIWMNKEGESPCRTSQSLNANNSES